jgi:hypothetical protein
MTTLAALLGGLPLMLGTGTGSEIRRPPGCAMAVAFAATPQGSPGPAGAAASHAVSGEP